MNLELQQGSGEAFAMVTGLEARLDICSRMIGDWLDMHSPATNTPLSACYWVQQWCYAKRLIDRIRAEWPSL